MRLSPWFSWRLRWPLPALLVWAAGWCVWRGAAALGLAELPAFALALVFAGSLAWRCASPWRRGMAAAGFPLSAWALGAAGGLPAWVWLLLLLPVFAAYPLRAWQDAPFFPTPPDALQGLQTWVGNPARVLDAGCGLGHGLLALRRLWPQAELKGLEWSALLCGAAAWRCRAARIQVQRADMWRASWAGQDLVYVFQRPESMARIFDKARRELVPGAWLASLEFAVPGQSPSASLQGAGRRPVWLYQPAGPALATADHRRPQCSTTAPACR